MKEYLDMLQKTLDTGVWTHNRTGIDTLATSGYMFEHDMSKGFPLLTTKKMGYKYVASELEMFIRGITNKEFLKGKNCKIWDSWCSPRKVPYSNDEATKEKMAQENDLGRIYGYQWRNFEAPHELIVVNKPKNFPELAGDTQLDLSVSDEQKQYFEYCYGSNIYCWLKLAYTLNRRQVSVRWTKFSNFLEDATQLPNWAAFIRNPCNYEIYPDYYGKCNCFTEANVVFVPKDDLIEYERNPSKFEDEYGNTLRYKVASNQLKDVIDTIKTDPTSRRLVVSAWNPTQLDDMALPPCHMMFELLCYPDEKKLDLIWFQRSSDLPLGVPADIASYAMLLSLIAKETGYTANKLIGYFGSCHIYENEMAGVKEQLTRTPKKLPTLKINNWNGIWNWKSTDMEIVDYESYPTIKMDVAV